MTDAVRTGKWIGGLFGDTPCVVAARRVLRRRLRAVDRLIEPASTRSEENPEYVHQLRVAARRSVAALQAFRPFCRKKGYKRLLRDLRRIRRGAGEARRLDVQMNMVKVEMERSSTSQHAAYETLWARLAAARTTSQDTIVSLAGGHKRLARPRRLARLLKTQARRGSHGEAGVPYTLAGLAAEWLPGVLQRVRNRRGRDLSDPIELHGLRIEGKKLRYALEVFAACYPPRLKELYRGVEKMLDTLGELNDLYEMATFAEQEAALEADSEAGVALSAGNGRSTDLVFHETVGTFRARYEARHGEFLAWWTSLASFDLLGALEEVIHEHAAACCAAIREHAQGALESEGGAWEARFSPAAAPLPRVSSPVHRRVAAIDVGTNSIRLVVGETDPLTRFRIIEDIKETTRLGSGVFADGRIAEEAMEASVRAIERMKDVSVRCRVDRIRAVGTSAVREAENRGEFLDRVERRTGVRLEVIDAEQEARLAFSSVTNTFALDDRRLAVADIGGGSTELVLSSGGVIDHVHPLPLGAVRLSECFRGRDGRERFNDMRRTIDKVIHERLGESSYQPYLIIGTGGTFTSLARVAIRHDSPGAGSGRFPFAVRGYELRHGEVLYFLEFLRRLPLEERKKVAGLSGQRAEIIVAGVCIIERLMQHLGVDRMRVHDGGIRDGLLAEMIDELGFRAEAPRRHLLTSLDGVRRFAQRCRYDQAHSEHVSRLALRLFDQLIEHYSNAVGTWSHTEARHLLQAAAVLHDVGIAVSYRGHHRHSYEMVLHADLPSYTRREVEIIANLCRYHRRRGPNFRHRTFRRLGDDDQRLVAQLSGILRIADGLDRMHVQDVLDVTVTPTARRTVLEVHAKVEPAENLRAARKKADVFEDAFQRTVRFVFTPIQDGPPTVPSEDGVATLA